MCERCDELLTRIDNLESTTEDLRNEIVEKKRRIKELEEGMQKIYDATYDINREIKKFI